ncbi:3-dehydroquinate dehydratase (3-dehydroquinase) [Coemansia sp. RSA 2618]|nr:3-dehydroquinate dehydratase (3-dehydroquinase) [Coemansia sp. RSA 2618]
MDTNLAALYVDKYKEWFMAAWAHHHLHLVGKALVGSGSDSGEWPLIECNFIQLVQFVTGRDLNRVAMDGPSFFVSLIALSVAEFLPAKLETLITSAQTIKLHADLLLRSVEFAGKMLARAHDDNVLCQRFVQCHHSPNVPLIALNMGYAGQMSRVLCPYLTPVTHPLLTSAAAPGQISMREIHQARALLAVVRAAFFLFGTLFQHSPSPAMHNAAFAALGLLHSYELEGDCHG